MRICAHQSLGGGTLGYGGSSSSSSPEVSNQSAIRERSPGGGIGGNGCGSGAGSMTGGHTIGSCGAGGLGNAVAGNSVCGIGSGSGGGGLPIAGIGGHGSGFGYPRFGFAHAGMVIAKPLPAAGALAGALGIDLGIAGFPSVVSPFPGAHFD